MARRLLPLALALQPLPALAQDLPRPPCGQAVEPAFGRRWPGELVRIGDGASSLAFTSPKSYLNRMMAFVGFLSGQPPGRVG
jgi:hypothetical protein